MSVIFPLPPDSMIKGNSMYADKCKNDLTCLAPIDSFIRAKELPHPHSTKAYSILLKLVSLKLVEVGSSTAEFLSF